MPLVEQFLQDAQGSKFRKVLEDPDVPLRLVLTRLDNADWQRRMIESEDYHDHAALAGVIKDIEALPEVDEYFMTTDGHETRRFRQAVGVGVRIVMENNGWETTGEKGSLGIRAKVPPHTTTPGAYRNTSGLSKWFTRAERYKKRK